MKRKPRLSSVMTPFPNAIDLAAPLGAARALMLQERVRHLPVVDHGELVGIVTDRDIKLLLGPEMGSLDPRELSVEDAYVDDCYKVELHAPLADALAEMARRHIGAAVVTKQGRLAGIFTAADTCRAFAGHLRQEFPPDGNPRAA